MTHIRLVRWGFIYSSFMLLAIGTVLLTRSVLLEVQGVHVVGTVTDETPVKGSDGDRMFQASFVFKDATGKDIAVKSSVYSNPPDHKVGDAVKLVYRTDHPETAKEENFFSLWFMGSSFLLAGMIGGGISFLFVGRKPSLALTSTPNTNTPPPPRSEPP